MEARTCRAAQGTPELSSEDVCRLQETLRNMHMIRAQNTFVMKHKHNHKQAQAVRV